METLQVNRKQIEKLSTVLNNSRIKIFEYLVDEDTLVVYNNKFHIEKTIAGYMDYIDNKSKILSCIGSTDDQHLYKYFEEIQC